MLPFKAVSFFATVFTPLIIQLTIKSHPLNLFLLFLLFSRVINFFMFNNFLNGLLICVFCCYHNILIFIRKYCPLTLLTNESNELELTSKHDWDISEVFHVFQISSWLIHLCWIHLLQRHPTMTMTTIEGQLERDNIFKSHAKDL